MYYYRVGFENASKTAGNLVILEKESVHASIQ